MALVFIGILGIIVVNIVSVIVIDTLISVLKFIFLFVVDFWPVVDRDPTVEEGVLLQRLWVRFEIALHYVGHFIKMIAKLWEIGKDLSVGQEIQLASDLIEVEVEITQLITKD